MEIKNHNFHWHKIIPLEIIVGILVLFIVFAIGANSDMAAAETQLTSIVDYIKQQCNSDQIRDLALESKSLIRVSESVEIIK